MEPLIGQYDFYFKIVLRTSCEFHLLFGNTVSSEHKISCDHDLIISSDHKMMWLIFS